MKIVFTCLEYDSYDPRKGKSFEYNNFYLQLKNLEQHKVYYFPYDRIREIGRKRFNRELIEGVESIKPDLFFAFMYTDELNPAVLSRIKQLTTSIAWFSDDHWRLEGYSRFYAPFFTWIVTTWSKAVERYKRYGINNVVRSQWGCDTALYKPLNIRRDIEVSFAGAKTKPRAAIIGELRGKGINVFVTGTGWPTPKLDAIGLVKLFSRTKINLNLNPSTSSFSLKPLAQIFFRRSCDKVVPDFWHIPRNTRAFIDKKIPQIKARPFEITGCGGFCLSGWADDIENYFVPDKEMIFYKNARDLAEKAKYYLEHDAEREAVARAGYERTLRDHTYQKRFRDIFKAIGL